PPVYLRAVAHCGDHATYREPTARTRPAAADTPARHVFGFGKFSRLTAFLPPVFQTKRKNPARF
ncbi:MAG TPA: hypothetical protein DEB39_13905, partial [Planctomycetaceae bacterium]|nr:hypothetical protein [Planctomycetaceae bacterium]